MAFPEDYQGANGKNYFSEDPLLPELVERRNGALFAQELNELGAVCGTDLASAIAEAHQDAALPRLEDGRVVYSAKQLRARRLAYGFRPLPPRPLFERMAMAYLLNINGEGGVTCPLAMTDGLIQLLESHGSPEQRRRYLPALNGPAPELPFSGGQFVTEKHSGSNVAENETIAELEKDGTWRLRGLKWFCSNPGELWVTTAKPKGFDFVGLFLVPRLRPDGSPNECPILKLKDLSGTRGKATAEVEYRGAYAEAIGRLSHGIAILLRTVLKVSRLHVACASLGFLRRAEWEAKLFAAERRAGGRPIAELPAIRSGLRRLEAARCACFAAFFEMIARLERDDPAAEVLVPLLKLSIAREATDGVREARLILAGHATLRDFSPLPRLAEDALIQEIWEGTHSVMAGHAAKALRRKPSRAAFDALIGREDGRAIDAALEAGDDVEASAAAWRGLRRRFAS